MVSMDKKETSYRGPDLKLFVRDVRDRQRKKRPISVRSWSTVKDVKDILQQLLQIPSGSQRLYFGPLLTSGGELPNHRTLHDAGVYRSGETLLLDIKDSTQAGLSPILSSVYSLRSPSCNDICISSSMMDSTPKPLRALVQEARRGFALGLKPELALEGSGGTYFMRDARKVKVAVFKPADEEPYAENNPRGYLRQTGQPMSLRDGVAPGEACIREVAAFLLDHNEMSGVPMTTLAEARHPAFNTNGARLKVAEGGACVGSHSISPNSPVIPVTMKKAGSFQDFVRCECTMDDISPSKISVDQVHKIAILDIRIMNADRNPANLLVRRLPDDSLELIPIDHGYCLRSVSDVSWMDWCWLDWPQLKKPLSEKMRKYVLELDIEADARLLSERLNICQEAIDFFRASSSLLKAGVRAGLTLYEIAVRCCRNDNQAVLPSMLEKLVDMACDLASAAIENERWHHTAASRALAEQLSPRHKRRSSLMSRLSSGSNSRLSKSASFVALRHDNSEVASTLSEALADERDELGRESPAMAQSSASDDSSSEAADAGEEDETEVEKEECECVEWAASIILDVSVEQLLARRGTRSGSIVSDDGSSDSGLSSSPKGFWHVRPGSSPAPPDDSSLSWSPHDSPRTSVAASLQCPEIPDDSSSSIDFKAAPTVSFAPGPFIAPKVVDVSALKEKAAGEGFPLFYRSESGMSRSKSYSALSAAIAESNKDKVSSLVAATPAAPEALAESYETFRMYFHKFIDLVIVREMTAATNNAVAKNALTWSSHGF